MSTNNNLDIIFNGVFGSKLYGVSTVSSDDDFKGVYLPSPRELIFNDYKDSIEHQTIEVDTSFYAATKFTKILKKCDTVSFDMIHTGEEHTITSTPLWEEIRKHRGDLYCKNMRGLLGYIKTQALKFAHKQDRFKEMKELLGLIEGTDLNVKISETTIPEIVQRSGFKFIKYVPRKGDVLGNIDVCGSRYQLNASIVFMKEGMEQKLSRYGERTIKGNEQGGDFKSMSHSLRVLIQLEELIETRDLIFPLIKAPEILAVKLGEFSQEMVMDKIGNMYDNVLIKLEKSDFPEENNINNIQDCILNHLDTQQPLK